jgi:hypothetical protein
MGSAVVSTAASGVSPDALVEYFTRRRSVGLFRRRDADGCDRDGCAPCRTKICGYSCT